MQEAVRLAAATSPDPACVNRNGQPFSNLLVMLARVSDPAYAEQIRDRNTQLLQRLDIVEAWLGDESFGFVPTDGDPEIEAAHAVVHIGCPHCCHKPGRAYWWYCSECQWTQCLEAAGDLVLGTQLPCADAMFPSGSTLQDTVRSSVGVWYTSAAARIHTSSCIDARDLAQARGFIEDHIDWAGLQCWGADFKKKELNESDGTLMAGT